MLKVMSIIGTRPELIKMSRVLAAFDKHSEHILVHTGQNYAYELNDVFFRELEIRKPNYFLECAGVSAAQTIARVIERCDDVLASESPDAVLIYGDTNSSLSAIAAKRRKIPLFHMEAGNRCFDQRVPEEINRKIVDHLSDVNLVLTEHARRYLLAEGFPGDRIFKIGSHMDEVLRYYGKQISDSTVCADLSLEPNKFFVVSAHREENVDSKDGILALLNTLEEMSRQYSFPIIVSTHPRTEKRLKEFHSPVMSHDVRFCKPFGLFDYCKLQTEAACVISDSGTVSEEAALLGFAAITIRSAHERPEGMDEAVVMLSKLEPKAVLTALELSMAQRGWRLTEGRGVSDYEGGAVSQKVLRIVYSYVDYIKRVVWAEK